MATVDLTKYGITGTTEIVHNPSYELLFEEETKADLQGYEKGQVSELGAVNVMTGIYTGRSPKDKYIVVAFLIVMQRIPRKSPLYHRERVTSISQFVRNGKRKRILKYIKKYGIRSVLLIRA